MRQGFEPETYRVHCQEPYKPLVHNTYILQVLPSSHV